MNFVYTVSSNFHMIFGIISSLLVVINGLVYVLRTESVLFDVSTVVPYVI